jgi:predicted RNase H-like HicB family nuclease
MKFIVEQHSDGFLAYPIGMKGVVVGQGDTRDEALADARSAARFHRDTFGEEVVAEAMGIIDAEVVDARIDD